MQNGVQIRVQEFPKSGKRKRGGRGELVAAFGRKNQERFSLIYIAENSYLQAKLS